MDSIVTTTPAVPVHVSGADRASYLEAVTTQHLTDATPGTVRGALHLDQHGAPLAAFDVVVLAEELLLLAPDDRVAATLVDTLGQRTFLSDATFTRSDARVVAVRGDGDAVAGLTPEGLDLAVVDGRAAAAGTTVVIGRADGVDLVVPQERTEVVVAALVAAGAREVDAAAFEAWRVAAGVPAWAVEIAPPHLPEELGLLPTHVHLAKGCYPGQEAVARMWQLGRPRRRLARLTVTGDVAPGWHAGEGRRRAEVTSVATHDGDRVALGFVPADAEPGTSFADGTGCAVTVLTFVGSDLPVPGHDPRVPRRRDRR